MKNTYCIGYVDRLTVDRRILRGQVTMPYGVRVYDPRNDSHTGRACCLRRGEDGELSVETDVQLLSHEVLSIWTLGGVMQWYDDRLEMWNVSIGGFQVADRATWAFR